jgi:phage terminase small subunit
MENFELVDYKSSYLNPTEKLYVRVYLSTLSHSEAHRVACGVKNPKENNPLSSRPNVQYHINTAIQERYDALDLKPEDIIKGLYSEAMYREKGSNHAARVTAWSMLGKHLNMFSEEKQQDEKVTYNIINYYDSSSTPQLKSKKEDEEEMEEMEEIEDTFQYQGIELQYV